MMRSLILLISVVSIWFCGHSQDQNHIDSLLEKVNSTEEDTSRINLLNRIASDLYYIDQERMYEVARQALELSEETGYEKGIADAYNNFGVYFRLKGIYDLASEFTYKSLEIMERTKNEEGIGYCYCLIGRIYFQLQNYNMSLEYFNKSLQIAEKSGDAYSTAGNNNFVGMVYEQMGNYDRALESYHKSLELNLRLNNKNGIAANYGNIGSLYQAMGNPKSLDYFLKRLELNLESKDIAGVSHTHYLIGKYYNSQSNFQTALDNLNQSKLINDSIGSLLLAKRIANEMSFAYAGLADFEKAYNFNKLYKKLNDSINLEENTQKITRLEMEYRFRKDQSLNTLKNHKTTTLGIASGAFLVFLIVTVLLLINRQRARVKQHTEEEKKLHLENRLKQEEVLYKDKLLQDNIEYLLVKNNLIASVTEQLIQKKSSLKKENQHLINEIILELQAGKESDLWEEFEVRFNQVHNDFYSNLILKVPLLTTNEKKLCAFLRLNMSTREIAAITHQSVSSIETARTRLRKKLNLANSETSLQDFLNQF